MAELTVLVQNQGKNVDRMMDALKIDQQNQLEAMAALEQIIRKEIAVNVKIALQSVVGTIQARTGSISREDCKWTVITRDDLEDWSGQIGTGSFGVVFKARWNTTIVAVKQCHEGLLGKQAFAAVKDEVEKWAKVSIHPNVVPMLGACIHTEKPFLVMPYYQHGNLANYLCVHPDVSVKQRVKWMYDLAAGLHHIHEQGIIHGDLKGDNVLVDHQYNALITDFGLSQIKRAGSSSTQQGLQRR
ncbi:kinase-like domain-containing protein [Gorgonomyces haynaldii]|nr:kinase-like domain-containing protein [Gorgonomyces haynaldii]